MPGNDQSFDVDAYLCYIFGKENEPEQVGEQDLHRPVQAPWPIGSDIGVTVLGRTIDRLKRRCDEQFAIHRAKDPELLEGMIDDPPEERFRGFVMCAIARCQALLEEAQQPQEPPSASNSVGGGRLGHLE